MGGQVVLLLSPPLLLLPFFISFLFISSSFPFLSSLVSSAGGLSWVQRLHIHGRGRWLMEGPSVGLVSQGERPGEDPRWQLEGATTICGDGKGSERHFKIGLHALFFFAFCFFVAVFVYINFLHPIVSWKNFNKNLNGKKQGRVRASLSLHPKY